MPNRPYLAVLALLGALLGAGVAAGAQTASPAAPPAYASPLPGVTATQRHRGGRMARALGSLGLSPAQRARIKGARQAYRSSRGSANPETRAQLRAQIEAVLTPSQRARFDAAMQHGRRHRASASASPGP